MQESFHKTISDIWMEAAPAEASETPLFAMPFVLCPSSVTASPELQGSRPCSSSYYLIFGIYI